jgi:hypothetical protein
MYNELSTGQLCPRALFVDLDNASHDIVQQRQALYAMDSYVFGKQSAGNNFAKGYLTEGAEMIDNVMERVRGLVEECDVLEGFVLNHALG